MSNSKRISKRVLALSTAVGVAVAGAPAMGAAVANAAPANPLEQLSSQAQLPELKLPEFKLPAEAVQLSSQFGIQLPDFLAPTSALDTTSGQLKDKTVGHLKQVGHNQDGNATRIAQEWANQGAKGQLNFHSGSQRGLTHNDKGTGSVKKLTLQEAKDRIVWLDRTANKTPDPKNFGVATATDGTYIYIAEYFFN